jgi:DNA modification methylase
MTTTRILVGDVRTRLASVASNSVHCVVTSPPYFGLRNYGTAKWFGGDPTCNHEGSERYYTTQTAAVSSSGAFIAAGEANKEHLKNGRWREGGTCKCGAVHTDLQIGLEATPDAYVAELVAVFRECRRVLRADGTLWLNLGDSYAAGSKWGGSTGGKHAKGLHGATGVGRGKTNPGLADKQRLMIPARVALALQADGWWLRDEIIWHKPNPMPVSVTDRTTPAHEMLYMFSRSARYYYDMEAIKEPVAESSKRRYAQPRALSGEQAGGDKSDAYEAAGVTKGSRRPNESITSLARKHTQDGTGNRQYTGFNDRFFDPENEPATLRQPRSVWSIATRPFKGVHFATFPPDLVRPCILAGCPIGGTVLDPFGGAGTTALVANSLQRNALLIELNPAYTTMAAARIRHNTSLRLSLGRVAA